LPAPFGPTNPVTTPGRTVNDIPSSASTDPNRFRNPATSIVASLICLPFSAGFRTCLYAGGGVSTVSLADTVLTPVTWHDLPQVT
jgi:hypothetical protein